jgi:hypothetical protein
MAGVERAEAALRDIIAAYKSHRAAKLIVSTDKGELKVIWEEAFALPNKRRKAPIVGKDTVQKMGESSWQRRREKRAADPAVRQRAATHAAAEAEAAGAEEAAAEKVAAAAEEAAAAAAGAVPAGEAARPGPKCSKCHEPTKGHTTGRAGPQCTALPRPERARDSSYAAIDTCLDVTPVKVDGRQEFDGDVASEGEEEHQVQKEHWPPWDAYRLMMDSDRAEHTVNCCDMPEGLDPAPSPIPARVFHPTLNITGVHDPNYHDVLQPDRTSYVAFYKFVKDGEVFHMECFEYV